MFSLFLVLSHQLVESTGVCELCGGVHCHVQDPVCVCVQHRITTGENLIAIVAIGNAVLVLTLVAAVQGQRRLIIVLLGMVPLGIKGNSPQRWGSTMNLSQQAKR